MVWWMQTCARLSWKSALLLKDLKTSKSWHPVVWLFACTKLGEHREFASLFTMTHQPRDLVHVDLKVKSSTCLQDILFVKLSKVLKCFKEVAFISIIFTYTFFSPIFLHLFSAMLFFSKKKNKAAKGVEGLESSRSESLGLAMQWHQQRGPQSGSILRPPKSPVESGGNESLFWQKQPLKMKQRDYKYECM